MRMNKVYNRIESITGNVITVLAKDVQYKELDKKRSATCASYIFRVYNYLAKRIAISYCFCLLHSSVKHG